MAEVRAAAMHHDTEITAALSDEERDVLVSLLRRVADQQGLQPDVHPGYRGVITGSVHERPDPAADAPN